MKAAVKTDAINFPPLMMEAGLIDGGWTYRFWGISYDLAERKPPVKPPVTTTESP